MLSNDKNFKKLTRGTKTLIKESIEKARTTNRNELCAFICENLEEKFAGETLDYQLKRMDLQTTGDILDAIDTYMYKHAKFSSSGEDVEDEE